MIWSVTAVSVDTRRPEPSTATTVTSVSPIISAAAVDAVRPGLRTALAPASSPATPPARRAGPADDAGERLDEPRGEQRDAGEQPEHAAAEQQADRRAADAAGEDPERDRGERGERDAEAGVGRVPGEPGRGSVAPSRTAAIGGTRVARRAGRMLASSVIPVPSRSETMIVCGATTVDAFGRSTPSAPNRAIMPFAIPSPSTSPITEASRPITRPSSRPSA